MKKLTNVFMQEKSSGKLFDDHNFTILQWNHKNMPIAKCTEVQEF